MDVKGKVAIVTGASSGFGSDLAKRLVQQGCKVVLGDISDNGQKLAKELGGVFVKCDVTNKAQVQQLFDAAVKHYGRSADIVINNAGIAEGDVFVTNEKESWSKVIDIDLTAVILGTRLAIQSFQENKKQGVIVNTASMAGLFPQPFQPVYAAAKGGVVHFTKSLGYLAKTDGIRVNCVCPGFVKTPLSAPAADVYEIKQWIPISRVTDAFMECIQNKDLKGDALAIETTGTFRVPFREMQGPLVKLLKSKL
ncbi:hypothetical protein EDD86DRAFT_185755 [Gorgonomyces haynaldii]|nr:hypothetical protein EDD86DRAFT_185755 [Gorgonomyces haynaldii]